MTVKLLLLKSGEDVIADVQEMLVGDEDNPRVIGYFLNKPCIVKMRDSSFLDEVENKENKEKKASYQVSLYPWMPLSGDKKISIPPDWVVTMVEPIVKLKEMYIEDVVKHGKDNQVDSSIERADFTEQD